MRILKSVLLLIALAPAVLMADTKFAVINIEQAIEKSKAGSEFTSYLQKQYAPKQDELKKIAEDGKALKEEYEKSGVFLSADERDAKRFEIQQKAKEFEMIRRSVAKSMDGDRREFLQRMAPQINSAMERLSKDSDVDFIVRSEAVIFAKPELDLTSALTEALNQAK